MTFEGNPKKLTSVAAKPFPIDALIGTHRRYAEAVAESVDHEICLGAMLSLGYISATYNTGLQVLVDRKRYHEPGCLYIVGILPPSERKTPLVNELEDAVRQYMRLRVSRGKDIRDAWLDKSESLERRAKRSSSGSSADADNDEDEEAIDDGASLRREIRRHNECQPHSGSWLVNSDVTVEGLQKCCWQNEGGVLLTDSEGSKWVDLLTGTSRHTRGGGAGQCDFFLKAWSAQSVTKVRSTVESHDIPRATMSMCVLMQNEQAQRLGPSLKGIGLTARILWMLPTPRLGEQRARCQPISDELMEWWCRKIETTARRYDSTLAGAETRDVTLCDSFQTGVPAYPVETILLSVEADRLLVDLHQRLNPMLRDGREYAIIKEWGGKSQSHATRIALALHVIEHDDFHAREISADTMRRAIQIFQWCANEALRIELYVTSNADSAVVRQLRKVADWIEQRQRKYGKPTIKFTPTMIRNAQRDNWHSSAEIVPYLQELALLNWIREVAKGEYETHPLLGTIELA